jgi:HD superfamily phosphohydrolase
MATRLDSFREFIYDFTNNLIGDYSRLIRGLRRSPSPKEFNDPVWKTILVQPIEVIFLDSPLLQRLRGIRQLGVAHWTYTGATHTRFEHTLGVLHQVQALVDSLNRRHREIIINNELVNFLRLTALCHDIGHGLMSHVSENALRRFDDIQELSLGFQDKFPGYRAKPSEIAAVFMVESSGFLELFEAAKVATRQHDFPQNTIELMKSAIIGAPISSEFPLLHELINGPFDADKLDYMTRDAMAAGVPVVTDIPRLIHKVRAQRVPERRLPQRIAKTVSAGLPSYTLTGIAMSGARTLDELMLGRILLFDKIYRHQKVRAAEAMISSIIDVLAKLLPADVLHLPYLFSDEQLIELTSDEIQRRAGKAIDNQEQRLAELVAILTQRLRERNLYVRCFAYAHRMPLDTWGHTEEQKLGLGKLSAIGDNPEDLNRFEARLAEETLTIIRIVEASIPTVLLDHLSHLIRFDPPEASSKARDIYNAHLITTEGEVVLFKEDTTEARGWSDAYPLARDLGYVFAPQELGSFVYLATEAVVRSEFGIRMPDSMLSFAKRSREEIEEIKGKLLSKGYYRLAPHDLRPVPLRLKRADVRPELEQISLRLQGYAGPIRFARIQHKKEIEATRLDPDIFYEWLRQFEEEAYIDAGLRLLNRVRLIGRAEIVSAIRKIGDLDSQFRSAVLTPLGEPKDSSAICTYIAGDIKQLYDVEIQSLDSALAREESRPIIFVDDFIGSGRQSVAIVETLLGLDPQYDLGERRQARLSDLMITELRRRQLAFGFAAGLDEGPPRLRERLAELKLNAKVVVGLDQAALPMAFSSRLTTEEMRFKRRCHDIGFQLLGDSNLQHDQQWRENRALGYGNHGLLVVFPYNTPAQSLTCLWAEGIVDEVPWLPLFPRRKKT